MSLPELKNNLISKIQNSDDLSLLIQISSWVDEVGDEPVLILNAAQKAKIETSEKQVKEGKFRQQADLFRSLRNG
jgi:tetraacyldisaccharide-1-P 4'-kinase